MARREEGAYSPYVTDEQRSQRGWIGAENGRIIRSRALGPWRLLGPEVERVGHPDHAAAPRGGEPHGAQHALETALEVRLVAAGGRRDGHRAVGTDREVDDDARRERGVAGELLLVAEPDLAHRPADH